MLSLGLSLLWLIVSLFLLRRTLLWCAARGSRSG